MNQLRAYIAVVAVALLFLAGWGAASRLRAAVDTPRAPSGDSALFDVLTDTKTGCQYIVYGNGIVPRMDADRNQVCKSVKGALAQGGQL